MNREQYRISKEKFESEISEMEKYEFYFRETKIYNEFEKVVSNFDKENIKINFDVFNTIYTFNRLLDEYTDGLMLHKFDFFETDIFTYIASKIDDLWAHFYNDEGFDMVMWYLYERSSFNDREKTLGLYDENGNEVDISTVEKFYNYLKENGYEREQ